MGRGAVHASDCGKSIFFFHLSISRVRAGVIGISSCHFCASRGIFPRPGASDESWSGGGVEAIWA